MIASAKVIAPGKRQPSQRDPTIFGHVRVPSVGHVDTLMMQEENDTRILSLAGQALVAGSSP